MAQDLVHEVTLWEPDLGSDITPSLLTNPAIWQQVKEFKLVERLGEIEESTFTFFRGAPLPLDTVLTERTVLKVQYGNPAVSYKLFRVVKIDLDATGNKDTVVHCRAMWADLANVVVRQTRANGFGDLSVTLVGQTLSQALTEIVASDHNLPSTFILGTVETEVASEKVIVQYYAATFLQVIQDLTSQIQTQDGYGCEYEFVWDNANTRYTINVYRQIGWSSAERTAGSPSPSSRPIHGPNNSTTSNRLSMDYSRDARTFFNRIIPLSGDDENPVNIAGALFYVDAASATTVDLESDVRIVHADGQFTGAWFGNDTDGFVQVTGSDTDGGAGSSNRLTFASGAAGLNNKWCRFALNSNGDDQVYIDDYASVVDHGAVEKTKTFPDISPYPNLLIQEGITPSMDEFTSGLANGWAEIGNPTTTGETGTEFFRFGQGAQKVVTVADNEGIEASFTVEDDDKNPHVSAWVHVRSDGANFVRIEFEDANGDIQPTTERAESNVNELRGIALGGFELAPGTCKLKIYAPVAGTTFYVDAVAITQSPTPYEYRDRMGPSALFHEGVVELAKEGGMPPPIVSGDFLDITAIAAGTEVLLGSHVEYKDIYSGTGSPIITANSRVVEIETREGKFEGRFLKKIRLSDKRKDFSGRFRGVKRDIPLPIVPNGDFTPDFPNNPNCSLYPPADHAYSYIQSDSKPTKVLDFMGGNDFNGSLQGTVANFTWNDDTSGLEKTTSGTTEKVVYPYEVVGSDNLGEDLGRFSLIFLANAEDAAADGTLFRIVTTGNTLIEGIFDQSADEFIIEITDSASAKLTIQLAPTGYVHGDPLLIGLRGYAATGVAQGYAMTFAGTYDVDDITSANAWDTALDDYLTHYNGKVSVRLQYAFHDAISQAAFIRYAKCMLAWASLYTEEYPEVEDPDDITGGGTGNDDATMRDQTFDWLTLGTSYTLHRPTLDAFLKEIHVRIDGALTVGDETLTFKNNAGTTIATIVIAQAGSAAGDYDFDVTLSEEFASGEELTVTTDGGNGTSVRANITYLWHLKSRKPIAGFLGMVPLSQNHAVYARGNNIYKIHLSTGAITAILTGASDDILCTAVDPVGEWVYYMVYTFPAGELRRVKFDGTGDATVTSTFLDDGFIEEMWCDQATGDVFIKDYDSSFDEYIMKWNGASWTEIYDFATDGAIGGLISFMVSGSYCDGTTHHVSGSDGASGGGLARLNLDGTDPNEDSGDIGDVALIAPGTYGGTDYYGYYENQTIRRITQAWTGDIQLYSFAGSGNSCFGVRWSEAYQKWFFIKYTHSTKAIELWGMNVDGSGVGAISSNINPGGGATFGYYRSNNMNIIGI